MQISLSWIRDFVDVHADVDPRELAERFTRTTAEVEGVHHIEVKAVGLIAARVESVEPVSGSTHLRSVTLGLGGGKTVRTVSAAPVLHVGGSVVFAPVGSSVSSFGTIKSATVAGLPSEGMILPGEAIGIAMAAQEAIWLNEEFAPGQTLPSHLFDDWIIEVDNKSLTHRPDLWGHYGIAREMAAMLRLPLKAYPADDRPDSNRLYFKQEEARYIQKPLNISIANPQACRRYSGMIITDVPTKPSPLWMQIRLGRVGLRPISALVDLTNYVMLDIGQPMHAFDADKVSSIEVANANEGERFRTLDGHERVLLASDLMIQQGGKSIALAGVMGGAETEVTEKTTKLLLESATFEPATIRRTASRLGLRTDASARFEKSLDPNHTVLSINRFLTLARPIWPGLKPVTKLSDCFPRPYEPITVRVDMKRVDRALGRQISREEITSTLSPLGFGVEGSGSVLDLRVPPYRATNDVSIEVDIIEELARCIGYDSITPSMPRVSVRRIDLNALHELEQQTLRHFTTVHGFHEIHGYIWYEGRWLSQLGMEPGPCLELRNPAAEGCQRLRKTLMPGILAAVAKNRFQLSQFSLVELGGVFEPDSTGDREFRHVGLVIAKRGKKADEEQANALKQAMECWVQTCLHRLVSFEAAGDEQHPWEAVGRTSALRVENHVVGRTGVVPVELRRRMDEHLVPWSIAWAEVRLNELARLGGKHGKFAGIPAFPRVHLDVSLLVKKSDRYAKVARHLVDFSHSLKKDIRFVGHYEGESVGAKHRALTFQATFGADDRTLDDGDVSGFSSALFEHIKKGGYEIRR